MSLAGAQDKLGVRFDEATQTFSDSVGQSPTTYIIKPDTRQEKYSPSAINEYACMKLAKQLKLNVPDVWFLKVPESIYIVKRYDREMVQGNIVALHQIDGCQLLGHGASWKYERQAGLVTLPKLVEQFRKLKISGRDLLSFQHWIMFNYLIGNSDAHGKNISLLISDKGYSLAPFYDLLCVKAYGDNSLALYIGDEASYSEVGRHSWEYLCQMCGFNESATLKEFRKMAIAIMPAWDKVHKKILKMKLPVGLSDKEFEILAKMTAIFQQHSEMAKSMTDEPSGGDSGSN